MNFFRTNNSELIAQLNEHVHTIHVKLYPEYFKDYKYESMIVFFNKFINNKEHLFLVLEENNEYIGYAWLELRANAESEFSKGFKDIYVHQKKKKKDYKGRGYGQAFMKKIYKIAKLYGINEIKLDYWIGNDEAAKFYKKQGFVKIREFVVKKLNEE